MVPLQLEGIMLTYNDIKNIPPDRWWENFDWGRDSFYVVEYQPWLLLTVPEWWKYFNWRLDSSILARNSPELLVTVPEWWKLYNWQKDSSDLVQKASWVLSTVPEWWKYYDWTWSSWALARAMNPARRTKRPLPMPPMTWTMNFPSKQFQGVKP